MKLIPAIDLMGGAVVQAQGGIRQKYRPLHTELFPDCCAVRVIQILLRLLDTDIIYLADLDAINKQGNHRNLILDLCEKFPEIEFWLDAGVTNYAQFVSSQTPRSVARVVGTETLEEDLHRFADEYYILSLDFKNGQLVGHNVLTQTDHWPPHIIALCLDRIGGDRGVDIACLKQLRSCYRGKIYAGGGVRNQDDLNTLSEIGISGAITANAIYNGTLMAQSKLRGWGLADPVRSRVHLQ